MAKHKTTTRLADYDIVKTKTSNLVPPRYATYEQLDKWARDNGYKNYFNYCDLNS